MAAIDCGFPDPATGLTCCWPLDPGEECCPSDASGSDAFDAMIDQMAQVASITMTRLSGYTIGQCSTTIRPLGQCADCRGRCCGGADGIRLIGPSGLWVDSVIEVRDGSDVVDPASWGYDAELQMLWRAPPLRWPKKDSRWASDGAEGAFCVDVVVGSAPDAQAINVANMLLCELIKSKTQKPGCRLPRNATQVVGQGVTLTLSDQQIKTMIPEVAGWVEIVNPNGHTLPARVYSPDLADHYRGGYGRLY